MIKNYFKIAWRSLWKNKTATTISIVGLSVGLACFILLGTYLLNELRFDRFHRYADRIALVTAGIKSPTDTEMRYGGSTPTAVAPTFADQFPEVEKAARVYQRGILTLRRGERLFNEPDIIYADSTFFGIFTYAFIAGDARTALNHPQSVVLTAPMAKKYFGDGNPIGQSILVNEEPWQVTGVVQSPPAHTRLQFSAVLSYTSLERSRNLVWHSGSDMTFLLLKNPTDFEAVQRQADALVKQRFAQQIKSTYIADYRLNIEKLSDVHLHSKAAGTGNITYLYILGGIAVGLLLIACINFTNLVTARSAERTQEIGVKKVLGAERSLLFCQFLFESAFAVFLAIMLGLLLAMVTLPVFNQYVRMDISMVHWNDVRFYAGIAILFILVSLIAGGWPALVLSAFKPISVLKGKLTHTRSGGRLRQGLVVFQFSISMLFVVCTVIAGNQLHYIQSKDTGLNRSQVIVLDGASLPVETIETFKNELLGQSRIHGVTASYSSPVNARGSYTILGADGKESDFALNVTAIPIEKDFVPVFDIQLLAGSNLTEADVKQSNLGEDDSREYAFIINELAAQTMGWTPEDALGKWINMSGREGRVKAVAANFNFASLHEEVKPIVLFPDYAWFGKLFIKTAEGTSMAHTLKTIESTWNAVNPNKPFEYHFLDQEYEALYRRETQTARVLNVFALITILVAAMGLFGLVTFTAQQRVKEIGIRKVLGASVISIVRMLSADLVKLVLIAAIIASPIAWWAMNKWLEDFAYRIDIQWWVFAVSSLAAVVIALFTVGWQAIRAAVANPVDSLRDE